MPSVRSDWVILSNWSGVISTWKLPTNGLVSVFVSLVIHAVTFSNILDLLISGKVRTSCVHWAAPHASKRCLILSKWSYIGIFQMPSYSNFVIKHFQCPNETDGNAITSSIHLRCSADSTTQVQNIWHDALKIICGNDSHFSGRCVKTKIKYCSMKILWIFQVQLLSLAIDCMTRITKWWQKQILIIHGW